MIQMHVYLAKVAGQVPVESTIYTSHVHQVPAKGDFVDIPDTNMMGQGEHKRAYGAFIVTAVRWYFEGSSTGMHYVEIEVRRIVSRDLKS